MKILHSYCLNHNIGDYFLGIGVKNILRHFFSVDLIAETNLQGTVFDEYYIDNVVNKKYDLLVIGGGGIIHGAHWPNGWFWLIKEELIKRIKIPFIVYGVGYNYFSNETGIPEIGKTHLIETIKRSAHFSVRNDGSLRRFQEQINVNIPVTPDPGFHVNLNREYECSETKPFVLVQLANDKPEFRFVEGQSRDSFVSEMRKVVLNLSKQYKVIFSPHVYDDIEISEQVSNGIPNTKVWDFSKYAFDRSSECVGYYENAEFVLAMRGHGQIIPISFNTPVISIENHPKHVGLMKELGLDFFNVPVNSNDFSGILLTKILDLETNKDGYINKLKVINLKLFEQTKIVMEKIDINNGN